ncbi:hypothetical protein NEPTK9_000380 [Candidatus Neptunochlamydia vexilliferae]|uniref:Uncharacterized protein n=1 Tax=Candidatus Neptunichlamydia vexilliferae TaxID=1651774 RepID=A0ABS0AXL5_9BACT|nr:hypothetical protein [Candidatus Neptunochlamydia vexilliferae]
MSQSANSNTLSFRAFCTFLKTDSSALSLGQCPRISFQKCTKRSIENQEYYNLRIAS